MIDKWLDPRDGKPMLLCLDLGSRMGWATLRADGQVAHGYMDLVEKGEPQGREFVLLRHTLTNFFKQFDSSFAPGKEIDALIVIEDVMHDSGGVNATHLWGGWWATVLAWAYTNDIPVIGYTATQIKKAVTGHGDAPKDNAGRERMNAKRAARKKPIKPYEGLTISEAIWGLGYVTNDHNERDAIAILHTHLKAEAEAEAKAA
jgi:Holliday junction resolvasome RuvABC endonuclease subunit